MQVVKDIHWDGIERLQLPYLEELAGIQAELESSCRNFPANTCMVSAFCVEELIGLPAVAGYPRDSKVQHAWNYDPQFGINIDLTLYQFSLTDAKIVISGETSPLHQRDEELCRIMAEEPDSHKRRELFKRLNGDMKLSEVPEGFPCPERIKKVLLSGDIGLARIPASYDLWL